MNMQKHNKYATSTTRQGFKDMGGGGLLSLGVAESVGFIMREHARESEQERLLTTCLFKDFECILRRNFPTWQPNLS